MIGTLVTAAGLVPAAAAETYEPGATMRTYQMAPGMTELCTLKSGQTPNVDRLVSTIDLESDEDFGATDHFVTHVTARLTVPTEGEYAFRLTSDDGSALHVDGQQIIDNDGLHGAEAITGTVSLTAGDHDLFVEHFEDAYGQRLLLEWRQPGESSFSVVPQSVLSTEAGVVRVTAPGFKYCEGATDTAGDGLRLDGVNPNYELVDLRPEGFEPKVSALAFQGDDLLVSTTGGVSAGGWVGEEERSSGEIFRVEGAIDANGPEDVTVTSIASGLLNPMGLDVIDDKIYVSERYQLLELSDSDDNGSYDAKRTVATWPDGGNFHEFAFGLIHDEENFYLNLSVAIDAGGASTNPQPGENRGTTLAIDRDTGAVTYMAGGLRTPNGIAFGPNGDIFAMDNQGGWLPASKLVHVEQGRFFNHYTNPPGPFDANPVTAPALWLPQNEIANSPSAPMYVDSGEFAGQMLFGDVTYGGLQRAFLEEVGGEYQGAAFRHTAGLEVGVNRVITGPDGNLYIGGTGEGGNWGESGKLRFGLQKLTTVNEDTFDIKEMRVTETGFDIEYTDPISSETAANIVDAYSVKQWSYIPTSNYGGPKIGEESLSVTDATVSEDGTTVSLDIAGLEPGHVVYVRSPRPFASASGQELWSTEAWYTLNTLPGYVAPPEDDWYEAEEGALQSGAFVDTEHNGFSGVGFVGGTFNKGAGTTLTVTVDEDGNYPVNVRYANGPDPFNGDKTFSVYVNGDDLGQWTFAPTGGWKQWATLTENVDLHAGANTIKLVYENDDDGNVNFDVLSIGEATDICTPADIEEGYVGLYDGTLESLADWTLAGPGAFARQDDCSLLTHGGLGLLWYTQQDFENYSLKLDWKLTADHNGGVFVGFPDPQGDPWVAVDHGYEIQIDATDQDDRTTGAVYTFQGADLEVRDAALHPVGEWNGYEIVVQGSNIKIYLNGTLVNDFTSTDPARDLAQGFIGIQNHGSGDSVYYRNIRIQELEAPEFVAESIEVTKLPTHVEYKVGDELNLAGLGITATSAEDTTMLLSEDEFTVTGFDSSSAGKVTLTATYNADTSISTTFDVTVYAAGNWYEAEEGVLESGAMLDSEHAGYSGAGYVGGTWNAGSSTTMTVNVDEAGTYPVNVRYANGPNPFDGDKTVSLFVNGEDLGDWVFPKTGAWNKWAIVTDDLELAAGTNTIELSFESGDDGNVNFDRLTIGEREEDEEALVESIEVTQLPSTTEYMVGDELDLDGLEVSATWTDSSTTVLTADEFTVTGFDSSSAGDVTLTVTYTADSSISTTFTVSVAEAPAEVESIEVTQLPSTTEYMVGDELDLDGLEVSATWTDSSTTVLTADEFTVTGFDSSSAGDVTLTVALVDDESISTTFEVTVSEPAPIEFTDVTPEKSLFFEQIMWLANQGITTGWTTDNGVEYRPLEDITRDAMAAFLYRYAGSPEVTLPDESPFVDVTPDSKFYPEIVWLSQQHISNGWNVGDGKYEFRPLEPITRDAMAAFLYRHAGSPDVTIPETSPFKDITSKNTEFYAPIVWMSQQSISTGWKVDGGHEYRPLEPTTRGAMAAFLYRYHAVTD